jgi:hypothetical protein
MKLSILAILISVFTFSFCITGYSIEDMLKKEQELKNELEKI